VRSTKSGRNLKQAVKAARERLTEDGRRVESYQNEEIKQAIADTVAKLKTR